MEPYVCYYDGGGSMDTKTLVNRKTRRTTLTLEADVADYLAEKLARNCGLREKNLVNDLIRKGIRVDSEEKLAPFEINPFKTKLAKGITSADIERMLDEF